MFVFNKNKPPKYPKVADLPLSFSDKAKATLYNMDKIPDESYIKYDVKRGLRNSNGTGVVVGLTRVGEVIGYDTDDEGNKIPAEGALYYRGYEIKDLVRHYIEEDKFGFEEITYLLIFGEMPSSGQFKTFKNLIGEKRTLPENFARDMILTAPSNNIMNKLARSVLAMYCYDEDPDNIDVANVVNQSISLIGYFPALIAYAFQAKSMYYDDRTLHLRKPKPELSTSENILRMIRGDGKYSDIEAKALDLCLILHAEHGGGNNSSFTTHLISSSGTDTYSAISAAIGSLKGPKHGGANIMVINMVDDLKKNVTDINDRSQVDAYLKKVLLKKANDHSGLIYGMGHAIYTLSDPRAIVLKGMAKKLAKDNDRVDEYNLYEYIEAATPRIYESVFGKKKVIPANVDLYSGFVYSALNIPSDIATPLFATARLSGWCAHRIEELVASEKLMRPAFVCVQEHRPFNPK